jgi:hypothetical protein
LLTLLNSLPAREKNEAQRAARAAATALWDFLSDVHHARPGRERETI